MTTQCRKAPQLLWCSKRPWPHTIIFTSPRKSCTRHAKPNHYNPSFPHPILNLSFNGRQEDVVRTKQRNINGKHCNTSFSHTLWQTSWSCKNLKCKLMRSTCQGENIYTTYIIADRGGITPWKARSRFCSDHWQKRMLHSVILLRSCSTFPTFAYLLTLASVRQRPLAFTPLWSRNFAVRSSVAPPCLIWYGCRFSKPRLFPDLMNSFLN